MIPRKKQIHRRAVRSPAKSCKVTHVAKNLLFDSLPVFRAPFLCFLASSASSQNVKLNGARLDTHRTYARLVSTRIDWYRLVSTLHDSSGNKLRSRLLATSLILLLPLSFLVTRRREKGQPWRFDFIVSNSFNNVLRYRDIWTTLEQENLSKQNFISRWTKLLGNIGRNMSNRIFTLTRIIIPCNVNILNIITEWRYKNLEKCSLSRKNLEINLK